MRIEVLNPVAETARNKILPAGRLGGLDGKKIGLWWNTKANGEVALRATKDLLQKQFSNLKFEEFTQPFPHGPEVYDVAVANSWDAVIGSTGD